MIKRQRRIQRIADVAAEYEAARTAAALLEKALQMDPGYGAALGWEQRHAQEFQDNLDATYIVRMYAEFEATLRDYWKTHRGKATHPPMVQLLNTAIPDQRFPQDRIDMADDVRIYRNYLVHDVEDEPSEDLVTFTVAEAKKHLCAYAGCLDPRWE